MFVTTLCVVDALAIAFGCDETVTGSDNGHNTFTVSFFADSLVADRLSPNHDNPAASIR